MIVNLYYNTVGMVETLTYEWKFLRNFHFWEIFLLNYVKNIMNHFSNK